MFARIAELGVPLFLHPGLRSATRDRTHGFREEVGLTWMYQTARAALELVDSGMLDAIPDLVVVHAPDRILDWIARHTRGLRRPRS